MKNALSIKSLLLTIFCLALFCQTTAAGAKNPADEVVDENTVKSLRSMITFDDPKEQLDYWRSLMPQQPTDARKDQIFQSLPDKWLKYRVAEEQSSLFEKTIQPVLDLNGKSYKTLVLNYNKPVLMVDSDSVLIATTELLKIAGNDAMTGLIAHEIAHSIFSARSSQIKAGLKTGQRAAALRDLAMIELFCDVFAAYTVKSMNLDATAFLKVIVESEKNYQEDSIDDNYHPSGKKRLEVIEKLLKN